MRKHVAMCLAAILATLSAAQGAAQAPPRPQDAGDPTETAGGPVDRLDRPQAAPADSGSERKRSVPSWAWDCRAARSGFSKQNWYLDNGAVGYAIVVLKVAAFVEAAKRGAIWRSGCPPMA